MADIRATLISNSDQLDNVDLMSGPRVFTIAGATVSGGEQPLSIRLVEYDRPWKPGLTVRRILDGIWGYETDLWTGRRVRLFRDEAVSFGKMKTGGTRISHATHIDKPVTLTLPVSKGKFGEFTIEPLVEDKAAKPSGLTVEQVLTSTNPAALKEAWDAAPPPVRKAIEARVAELEATA